VPFNAHSKEGGSFIVRTSPMALSAITDGRSRCSGTPTEPYFDGSHRSCGGYRWLNAVMLAKIQVVDRANEQSPIVLPSPDVSNRKMEFWIMGMKDLNPWCGQSPESGLLTWIKPHQCSNRLESQRDRHGNPLRAPRFQAERAPSLSQSVLRKATTSAISRAVNVRPRGCRVF
jgi:hypothetical protein